MTKWLWGLLACAITLLLIPAGLVIAAPVLAPLPPRTMSTIEAAPPLPEREDPLPGFQDLLDPLPLVVRDLPEPASREAVTAYDSATLLDIQATEKMFAAAERAISVPAEYEALWNDWITNITSTSAGAGAPIPDVVLNSLRTDPRNGDRLSNIAVALYFMVLTENLGKHNYADGRNHSALRLLDAVSRDFPESRAAVLNSVYLSSFLGGYSDKAIDLREWVAAHPNDLTALQLFVFRVLHARTVSPEYSELIAHLNQLSNQSDGLPAALAHALLGDLQLELAHAQQVDSPFTSQLTARQALREYDMALAFSDDPSLYAARAETLELMGNIAAAIETQKRAIQVQPDSAPLVLQLGDLYGAQQQAEDSGDLSSMVEARELYRIAFTIAGNPTSILLSDVQLQVDDSANAPPGFASRVGRSYVAFRPARMFVTLDPWEGAAMAGAGYILFLWDLIPEHGEKPHLGQSRLPGDLAASSAIVASVVLGDAQGASTDVNEFLPYLSYSQAQWGRSDLNEVLERAISAAQLVADPSNSWPNDDNAVVYLAIRALEYAGPPEQAAVLCRQADDLGCLGANAYRAEDMQTARRAFAELEAPLYEGFVAQAQGDKHAAVRLYTSYLTDILPTADPMGRRDREAIVTGRLGDAYLDLGDATRAIEFYDRAIPLLTPLYTSNSGSDRESFDIQHVRNNRAVARLKLQMESGAPNCSGTDACADALSDFETALHSDPHNPVYLMGKGWAERLLGNPETAIQTLDQAIQIDATLYPALNDIGVLAAQMGDTTRAQQSYLSALAANPDYDLALWNLGVFKMQRGIRGIFQGQAYLARAIRQNPTLATSALTYRTDESIYRVEFNGKRRPGAGWSFGAASSVTVAGLGFVALLAILLPATDYILKDQVQGFANRWLEAMTWRGKRGSKYRSVLPTGEVWPRWFPLIITLPVLVFVTSWSAFRAEPESAAAAMVLALFAASTAVITHGLGHVLMASKLKARVRPAQWRTGTLLALVLLPLNLSAGPFPGEHVQCESEQSTWWVYLGGPLANLLAALGMYALYLIQPLPGLRLIVLAQLAAMSYALLPFEPLDGAVLSRSHRRVAASLAFFAVLAGVLLTLGIA